MSSALIGDGWVCEDPCSVIHHEVPERLGLVEGHALKGTFQNRLHRVDLVGEPVAFGLRVAGRGAKLLDLRIERAQVRQPVEDHLGASLQEVVDLRVPDRGDDLESG